MSKTEMTANALIHPALNFFYTYITAKESHFFLSELSSNCHFLQICWKTRKITAVTVCVLAVSCVSLWASCHCWERLHSHVSHSRCFILLVWSHSVLMSVSALFPFCTSTPCHTTPTTSTYRWESQSALCSVCLTLCHCCPCKVYSLILCANNAPVYLLSAFFSCYLLLFLLLFLSAKKKKGKKWDVRLIHVASLWSHSWSIAVFSLSDILSYI